MRIEQASEIARLLGVPVNEVMRRAGANVPAASGKALAMTPPCLPLVGWAGGDEAAHIDWTDDEALIEVPIFAPPTAGLVQWRTAQSRLEQRDGWFMVTLPPSEPDIEAMLDRFCVIGVKGGDTLVRTIRRGYTKGRYALHADSQPLIPDAELAWFSPVLAIVPPG